MEAVNFVSNWTNYLLLLIPPGAGLMVAYHAFNSSISEDEGVKNNAKIRIRNTIMASIIMESIVGLIAIIKKFYL
jgi:hypothetical protein